jgi:hypothetical protein
MKMTKLLSAGALVLLLAGWGIRPGVWAQEGPGSEATGSSTLGIAASATDVWGVLCPLGTSFLTCQVTDAGGVDGIRFGVCCENKHGPLSHCRNAPDGGSVATSASSGPGEYEAKIFKAFPVGNAATVEPYRVDINCRNSTGGLLSTLLLLIQNE